RFPRQYVRFAAGEAVELASRRQVRDGDAPIGDAATEPVALIDLVGARAAREQHAIAAPHEPLEQLGLEVEAGALLVVATHPEVHAHEPTGARAESAQRAYPGRLALRNGKTASA